MIIDDFVIYSTEITLGNDFTFLYFKLRNSIQFTIHISFHRKKKERKIVARHTQMDRD
jgi:hypothetical protein